MSRKFSTKGSPDSIPSWLSLKIRDAGASAYAWGESELLARIDPDQRLQRINDYAAIAATLVGSSVLAALGFSINTASGLITLVICIAALVHSRARTWSPLTLAVGLVALWPLRSELLGIASLALLVTLAALAYLRCRGSLAAASGASFASLWAASAGMADLVPLALTAIAGASLIAAGIIRPKLGNDVLFLRPGTPPSTIPLLIRILKRRDIRNVPDDIRRKTLGAEGERATALRLMGLQGRRVFGFKAHAKAIAVHDIASLDPEKTRANLDHLLLTSHGIFVLDTKVFARGSLVTISPETSDVLVATTGTPPKSILPLVRALAKECAAARTALNHEVTGFLVIHGARVPSGISIRLEDDGVTVEVIDQKDLIGRLDAPRRGGMRNQEYKALAKAILSIPSASGGRSVPVRPLGITFANRPRVAAPSTHAIVIGGVGPAAASPPSDGRGVKPMLARWDAMVSSVPAPPDLVEADLQVLRRGERFEVFSIAEDLSSLQMFAMSGVCQASDGSLFVWATNDENWQYFLQTNRPVQITQVPAGNIITIATSNS